jgi:hypothetical protein
VFSREIEASFDWRVGVANAHLGGQGVRLGLLKTEANVFPSFVPETGLHDRSALGEWASRALW